MGLTERISDVFEIPAKLISGVPRVTITGGGRVQIENRGEIEEFTREKIRLRCGRIHITVLGSGLELEAMSESELSLCGSVTSVEVS